MSFLKPKFPKPVQPVDPADAANRVKDQRTRRLQSGGSNATFLDRAYSASQASKPTATLTGLQGG